MDRASAPSSFGSSRPSFSTLNSTVPSGPGGADAIGDGVGPRLDGPGDAPGDVPDDGVGPFDAPTAGLEDADGRTDAVAVAVGVGRGGWFAVRARNTYAVTPPSTTITIPRMIATACQMRCMNGGVSPPPSA